MIPWKTREPHFIFFAKINKKVVAGNPHHDYVFLAGAVGLEPTTNGFGDRYSTN